jgi:hypothetical protein
LNWDPLDALAEEWLVYSVGVKRNLPPTMRAVLGDLVVDAALSIPAKNVMGDDRDSHW